MPLVPAKCPNCGGNVVVDNEKDAWVCDFCKTPFIVEKAINNFNTINNITNNVTNNNDIKADVVNVYESKEKDFVIKAGILEKYIGEDINIVIPNTVKKIGKDAFKDLLIETVDIPDSVVVIESGAFYNCKDLQSVVMTNSVERIESGGHNPEWPLNYALYGGGAFEKCSNLNKVIISNELVYLGNNAFSECVSLRKIQLPSSLEHIGDCAFKGCTELQEIGSTENVISLGCYAFSGCSNIKKIDIHNAIEMDGSHTFSECSALEEVELPERITNTNNVWRATFACNNKLKYVKIPEGVKSIECEREDDYINPKEMFHDCGSLENLFLPESCSSIVSSFKGCRSLKTINIPNSTYFITDGCFSDCNALANIDVSSIVFKKNIKAFVGTPFWQNKKGIIDYCPYCGGQYKGVFSKRCSICGKEK